MTAANPPEVDLTLSRQAHESKNEIIFCKGDLMTAATPPEIVAALSKQGHQSKNGIIF